MGSVFLAALWVGCAANADVASEVSSLEVDESSCVETNYEREGIYVYGQGVWFPVDFKLDDRSFDSSLVDWDRENALLSVAGNSTVGGELNTVRDNHRYGSFRAVMKTSAVPGTSAAFFYHLEDTSEINLELLSVENGENRGRLHGVIRHKTDPIKEEVVSMDLPFNPSDDFHEYGFDWDKNEVAFFLDGVHVFSLSENVPTLGGTIGVHHWSNGDPLWTQGPPREDAVLSLKSTTLCDAKRGSGSHDDDDSSGHHDDDDDDDRGDPNKPPGCSALGAGNHGVAGILLMLVALVGTRRREGTTSRGL